MRSTKNDDIGKILSNSKLYWKLSFCPKRRPLYNEYRIAIEGTNNKRQYTCLTFDDLFELINKSSMKERCYYEHISCDDAVKFYLDYEYYKIKENEIIDVDRALISIRTLFINVIRIMSNYDNISIDDMVLLQSSFSEKESFHIILDNDNIRFFNNQCVCFLIQEIFRVMLLFTLNHECLRKRNNINKRLNNESSINELMNIFNSVRLEWFSCTDCLLKDMGISVADVCNVFVYDKKGRLTLSIDLKVYAKEQDFRMFMCSKSGENRPLIKYKICNNRSYDCDILSEN